MSKLLTDALTRKKWITEGLIQKNEQSFWAPYTGTSDSSIVYKSTNSSAKSGHTTTFDYSGNLAGRAVKGKNTAFGKGEQKKKFSSTIIVERYRLPVDNGDKFDGVDFGDLAISQHSDSRSKLGDLYIRFKDQILFDAAQGNLRSSADGAVHAPTHSIDIPAGGLTFAKLNEIETTLKTSIGYDTGGMKRPMPLFRTKAGQPMWLFAVDALTARDLKADPDYRTLLSNADHRGNKNRVISGLIGVLGALVIVEAGTFFGDTTAGAAWGIEDSGVEIAGLRTKDGNGVWAGQEGFDPALAGLMSRNVILGAGALQFALGKMPDYKHQFSDDFQITSESALEVWLNAQKTKLTKENEDYSMAKVSDSDWAVVTVDVTR